MTVSAPTRTEGSAQAIGPLGTSGPAGATDTRRAISAAAKQLSLSAGPWDAKQEPTCGRRSAPLLTAQPADANLRSLFGFASREEPLVVGSKSRNGSK
jgi:hypothetical protein